jgi:hypothetical protein
MANKMITLEHDPEDSWAEVELFRWQYGQLPGSPDDRRLDKSKGLAAMAKAIEEGCAAKDVSKMPHPMNICSVLNYCARKMNEHHEDKAMKFFHGK